VHLAVDFGFTRIVKPTEEPARKSRTFSRGRSSGDRRRLWNAQEKIVPLAAKGRFQTREHPERGICIRSSLKLLHVSPTDIRRFGELFLSQARTFAQPGQVPGEFCGGGCCISAGHSSDAPEGDCCGTRSIVRVLACLLFGFSDTRTTAAMDPSLITHLMAALAAVPSSPSVSNPYTAAWRLENLRAYLSALCAYPYSGHLFVGEAPGYRGCAQTGIPFTSEKMLRLATDPFTAKLLSSLTLAGNTSERTATIVWQSFAGKEGVPAFWNTFPFHPHLPGNSGSNRKPTAAEITLGAPFTRTIVQILEPHTIVSVGRVAESVVKSAFPHLPHIMFPHPSHQGTAGFVAGCAALNIS